MTTFLILSGTKGTPNNFRMKGASTRAFLQAEGPLTPQGRPEGDPAASSVEEIPPPHAGRPRPPLPPGSRETFFLSKEICAQKAPSTLMSFQLVCDRILLASGFVLVVIRKDIHLHFHHISVRFLCFPPFTGGLFSVHILRAFPQYRVFLEASVFH